MTRVWMLVIALLMAPGAFADTTITVDGDLDDWPDEGFDYYDHEGDLPPPWGDVVHVWATDDNASGSDGNLYLAIEFSRRFRDHVGSNDVDVYIFLDIDGDGQIGGREDRIVEVTEGGITDGDGNPIGTVGEMEYDDEFMEISIPYAVLGLEYGSDVFGMAVGVTGKPPDGIDYAPNPDEGDGGLIVYDGTQEPEPRSVLLADLVARAERRGVTLHWSTGSERGNLGFHVYRLDRRGHPVRLTRRPVPGLGNAPVGQNYHFHDPRGRTGDRYLIEDRDVTGRTTLHRAVVAKRGAKIPAAVRRSPRRIKRTFATIQRFNPQAVTKFAVRAEGLVSLDASAMPRFLSLTRLGRPIPYVRDKTGVHFVGAPVVDRYADYEVIHAGPGRGLRMAERNVTGWCECPLTAVDTTLRLEERHVYHLASPTADPFYWAQAFEGTPAVLRFDLPRMTEAPSVLKLGLAGMTSRHHITLRLNDAVIGERIWRGRSLVEVEVAIPAGLAREQDNRLEVVVVPDDEIDLVFVDGIEATYRARLGLDGTQLSFHAPVGTCLQVEGTPASGVWLFDVTDPGKPVRLRGHAIRPPHARFRDAGTSGTRRYLLVDMAQARPEPERLGTLTSRNLSSPILGADYLVITHPDFLASARRMAEFHTGRGLETMVVTTEEVYDRFGGGRPSPLAHRELVRTSFDVWHQAPRFVLLVGGSTVDPNGYLAGSPPDFLPAPFWKSVHGYEAASDGWYVAANDGVKPRAAIGRLPVVSPGEADAVVDKILTAYEQLASPAGRFLIVADDYDPYGPDPTGAFEIEAEGLIGACAPAGWEVDRVYKARVTDPPAELRERIEGGVDVVNYLGHAYLSGWSSAPVLVDSAAAAGYTNEHLFLLFSWTCFDGAFVGPWAESLAWSFVRNPQGGAALATAASSLSDPDALGLLSEQLLCHLTAGRTPTVGETLALVKRSLAGLSPGLQDLLATYNLLGDPAFPNPF